MRFFTTIHQFFFPFDSLCATFWCSESITAPIIIENLENFLENCLPENPAEA